MIEPSLTPFSAPPRKAPPLHPLLRVAIYLLIFLVIQDWAILAVFSPAFRRATPAGFLQSKEAVLLIFALTLLPMLVVTQLFVRVLDHRSLASLGVRWPAGG